MTSTVRHPEVHRIHAEEVHAVIERSMLKDGLRFVVDLDSSQGSYLVDKLSGHRYLDCFTYFATQPIGHNHPAILDPEFRQHIERASLTKPSNSDVYTEEMAAFVDMLDRTAQPKALPNLFMVSGGALAVENALKTAFDWKFQKRAERGLADDENLSIIHFREAFHGRSGYTMSLTNTDPSKIRHFPKFDWPRVLNPKMRFPLEEHLAQVEWAEDESVRQIEEAVERHGDHTAAIIIEPIQGEGGDNHFRGEFLRRLRQICDDREMLLIVDEVQTGVGTTGKWWAYEHFGFEPDVLAFGKKMQVCGILAGDRVNEVDSVFKVSSRINSTWGGDLVDKVRATRYLQVIHEEGLLENAALMGRRLTQGLEEIHQRFPGRILNVRGRGLFVAFTLADAAHRDAMLDALLQRRLLALSSGADSVRFRPPLTVSAEECDQILEITEDALKALSD